jgi:hypothetical protein
MREAEEVERFRLRQAVARSPVGREAVKTAQAGRVRVQVQTDGFA